MAILLKNKIAFAIFTGGLTFSGLSYSNIGGICCPFSDSTLKEDVKPLENSLEKVLKLDGFSYKWKKDGTADIGLIAQDVEKVFPEVIKEKDGLKQIDYQKLIAPVIVAIREQQKEIEAIKAKFHETPPAEKTDHPET